MRISDWISDVCSSDLPTKGLMGAIDLAPTLMSLAGLSAYEQASRFPGLPGLDVSGLLASPTAPTERDRQGHLFNYAVVHYWEPTKDRTATLPSGEPDYSKRFDLSKRRLDQKSTRLNSSH